MPLQSPMPPSSAEGRAPLEVDLLVVGSLTVDTFADGGNAPGGSVLHAARAATAAGLRVGVVTSAGDEPEARAGIDELSRMAAVHAEPAPSTIAFRHVISGETRALALSDRGAALTAPSLAVRPAAVLYAPLAAEFGADLAAQAYPGATTGAVLQGWLRSLEPGQMVRALPLTALDAQLVAQLARMRLVCASTEDLAAEPVADPAALLDRLRDVLGPGPVVALTDGRRGVWLDDRGSRVNVPPPRVVDGVDTTGAGDAFAAVLLHALAVGHDPLRATEIAVDETARFLRRRSRRRVAIGDVHGHHERLARLLVEAGLMDAGGAWQGGTAELWFLGDLTDRGPDGIGVIELVRRLQGEARATGGRVESVLGNHEVLLLAAYFMPEVAAGGPGGTFRLEWMANGGRAGDLARMTPEIAAWLRARPAMALVDDDLLIHADALGYARLGESVDAVNAAVARILAAPEPAVWDQLLGDLSERRAFSNEEALGSFLDHFGALRVIHGHTPVAALVDGHPAVADRARRYGTGRAVAADPGLYLGGPGFVVEL